METEEVDEALSLSKWDFWRWRGIFGKPGEAPALTTLAYETPVLVSRQGERERGPKWAITVTNGRRSGKALGEVEGEIGVIWKEGFLSEKDIRKRIDVVIYLITICFLCVIVLWRCLTN